MLYRFADLVVRSDLALSALPDAVGGPVECSIHAGPPEWSSPTSDRWDHHWRSPGGAVVLSCAREGDAYRLGMPGLATFLIEDGGRTIRCRPHGHLPPATVEHLLIDQVLPRVLTHLGRTVIHAGGVVTPHGALALLGDSGAGKSTLCAEFSRAGCPLVGDDGLVLRPAQDGGFEVLATYPGLRLFPEPLAACFHEGTPWAPVAHYSNKRRVDRSTATLALATDPQPLLAIYVLEPAVAIGIAPVPDRDAFMALVRASFQLHLGDAERSRDLFLRLGTLRDAVPVRRLSLPRDLTRLSDVREALQKDAEALATRASSAECACS